MQSPNFDLKKVFCCPLNPIPWLLGGPLGELNKTNKATTFMNLKKELHQLMQYQVISLQLHGMPILRNENVKGKTSGQLARNVLKTILASATILHV